MREPQPKTIYLKDYTPPAFLVDEVELDIDIRTAKDASVPSILVSFGYAREALGELVPDAVINHFDELVPSASSILGVSPGRLRRR